LIKRRSARLSPLLVAIVALVVAACGGTGATNAPPSTASTATSEPPASFNLPDASFVLPSFEPNPELEAMFPERIGGQPLQVLSMSGAEFMASESGVELAPVLDQLQVTADDLSVAFGGTQQVTVVAFQIKGVSAKQFFNAYLATAPGAQDAAVTDATFSGKTVKKVVPADGDTVYLYLHGDVMWTVGGTGLTDALLTETFSKLP
jgi:hypothetical protein